MDPVQSYACQCYDTYFLFATGYCFFQGPATCMVRPHPALWRIIHGVVIIYLLALVFLLFQNVGDARQLLKVLPCIDCFADRLPKNRIVLVMGSCLPGLLACNTAALIPGAWGGFGGTCIRGGVPVVHPRWGHQLAHHQSDGL
jgi:hypothetical protein